MSITEEDIQESLVDLVNEMIANEELDIFNMSRKHQESAIKCFELGYAAGIEVYDAVLQESKNGAS